MIDINTIKQGQLHKIYPHLYGKFYTNEKMDSRFIELINSHKKFFNKDSAMLFSTAGRSELGGNHTDHNLGKVLACTISLDTIAAVTKTDNNKVSLISEGFPQVEVDLSCLDKLETEKNTTNSLIRGIAKAFSNKGYNFGGFNANTTTNVLKGSGLSSSAAIEILCATIFNHIYNNDELKPVELSIISQFAENEYYGKPSGLMDQIACANGGIVEIDFKNNSRPIVKNKKFSFEKEGYSLVIVDTKGDHENLTDDYASIPKEMKIIASYFGKKYLREISFSKFKSELPLIRKKINNDRAILRTIHFFNENKRVEELVNALDNKDFNKYLNLINQSGQSSFCFLQNLYSNSTEQGLSLAIAISTQLLNGKGACRVHGGGFAGTIQAYVPNELLNSYITEMDRIFGENSTTKLAIREYPTCCLI